MTNGPAPRERGGVSDADVPVAARVHSPRTLVDLVMARRPAPHERPDVAGAPQETTATGERRRFSDFTVGVLVLAVLTLVLAFGLLFE